MELSKLSLVEFGQNIHIIRPYGSQVGGKKMPCDIFYCKDDEDIKGTVLTTDDYLLSSFIDDDSATQQYIYYQITSVNKTHISYYDHYELKTIVLRRQGIPYLKNRYYLRDSATQTNIKYWASENDVMNMLVDWYHDIKPLRKEYCHCLKGQCICTE